MDIRELVIYRNLKHQTLFEQMAGLMGMSEERRVQILLPVRDS